MAPTGGRTILHVDMDAFFASVEQLRHPELQGRPVVVGGSGDPHQRAVVSTASYEARRFGIHSGMPLRTALARCPEAVFLPVDYPVYAKISRRIMLILHEHARHVEEIGIDEAFLDLTHAPEPPEQLACAIQAQIRQDTGLDCSVGIGPNKLLAKIASGLAKPHGLTRLTHEDIPARVWPQPARSLWGVGPRTEERLADLGVRTIGELASLSRERLISMFGKSHGAYLYEAARGIDESPVRARRGHKSLGRETTFQQDVGEREALERTLGELVHSVAARLRQYHYLAGTITVTLRLPNFETHSRAFTLPVPTADEEVILAVARGCLDRLWTGMPVRLLGLRLGRLQTLVSAARGTG